MRVFVAGATGTLGRPLVHRLLRDGHSVTGLARSAERAALLERLGAAAVLGDALDGARMDRLVGEARPDAVVHLLTALPPAGPRRVRDLEPTNELRRRGTAHLVRAARAAGARRLVAESFVLVYGAQDHGPAELEEDRPLAPADRSFAALRPAVEALRDLERQVLGSGLEAVVLRLGVLTGPGVPSFESQLDALRRGRLPIPGRGEARACFVRLDAAVDALARSVAPGGPAGILNIVEDDCPTQGEAFRSLARAAGGPEPRSVPRWIVRLVAPAAAAFLSTSMRVSNAKAKRALGGWPGAAERSP